MIALSNNGPMITCGDRRAGSSPLNPSGESTVVQPGEDNSAAPTESRDENVDPVRKTRKTRRGKKRKSGQADDFSSEPESPKKPPPRKRQVMIRPADVPKAPANFTQFIIDDHENCALYQSFESPSLDPPEEATALDEEEPASPVAGDDEYVYLDYGNMVAFYEKDFEAVYSTARVDELLQLPQKQVAEMYSELERRAAVLRDELEQCDPRNRLDDLQRQLLDLQEENRALRLLNRKLRTATEVTTSSSGQEEPNDES